MQGYMKRIVFIGILCVLSLVFVGSAMAQEEMAQEDETLTTTSMQLATPEAKMAMQEVVYTMPYPGLLPDSPLYPLKAFRDKVVSVLISDPQKQAEFDLLQADKRLGAGIALLKKNKKDYKLAESTIDKGENYFGLAIDKTKEAKK